MEIVQQMQPTGDTCQPTSVAMVLDLPAQEVIEEFYDAYVKLNAKTSQYITSKGLTCRYATEREELITGNLYICGMASLNIEGATHAVLIDFRDQCWAIYDPNRGKEGKKFYTFCKDEALDTALAFEGGTVSPEIVISKHDYDAYRDNRTFYWAHDPSTSCGKLNSYVDLITMLENDSTIELITKVIYDNNVLLGWGI